MRKKNLVEVKAKRAKARRGVCLEDRGLAPSTRLRYFLAVRRILPLLVRKPKDVDSAVGRWIQDMYEDGEAVSSTADALSGLHHFAPWTKGRLNRSWRLFRLWRRIERPKQAPPLPQSVCAAFVGRALELHDLEFALGLCLGFWGLLRTGEILDLQAWQIMIGDKDVVVRLGYTKTGLRRQQDENVVIRHTPTHMICKAFLQTRKASRSLRLPCQSGGGPAFREKFRGAVSYFGLTQPFRPYSLRRGGATHDFRVYNSMERTLIKGRWGTSQAARQYIQEGLSVLTTISLSSSQVVLLKRYAALFVP